MPLDVLFVCVHNAGRSQMARAIFNARVKELGLELRADSAGTIPGEKVHPAVIEAMAELGLDVSAEAPRLLTDDMLEGDPRVITMGCAVDSDACPSLQLENVIDWGLPDPKDRPLEEVRSIRDEIRQRVDALLEEMVTPQRPL